MKRKRQKFMSSPDKGRSHKKKQLCALGLKLKPSCGMFLSKFDLRQNPMLRHLLNEDVFPPYSYEYVDADTVIMDGCLICHLKKGIPPQVYEMKHEAVGITRSNWEEIKPIAEAGLEAAAQKIRDERRFLSEDLRGSRHSPKRSSIIRFF
jgi:hypothetical protein